MKKKILAFLILCVICAVFAIPSSAAELPRLIDQADLLTTSEEIALTAKLDEMSARLSFDVVVLTVEGLPVGYTPEEYAVEFYDTCGYGYGDTCDGTVLLISMEERDWYFDVCGWGQDALNEDAREYISDEFLSDLSDGNYASAFNTYADLCDKVVTDARNGIEFKKPFNLGTRGIVSFIISLIVGLIATSSMKNKLLSVHKNNSAANYVAEGSLNIVEARENYLYSRTSSTVRQTSSSSSSRSSGSGHSGSGGKF